MKYSIIVPVYNVEKYLEKCLNSLINQKIDSYEIIVVNDGSTDNSQKIIDNYKKTYPNKIFSYTKENGGLSSARNYGISKSNGEYLLFVDSDDYIDNNCLKILDDNLKEQDSDILVFNFYLDNNGLIEKKGTYFNNIDENIKKYITANPSACNKLFKKKLFIDNKIEFINGIYYEDLATVPSIAKYTNKIKFIDEALYYYCVRTGSIMNKVKYNKKMEDIFNVVNINYNNYYECYYSEVEYLYIEHLLRYASLRFLDYNKYDMCDSIINIINDKFKNWNNNKYYKQYYNFKQKLMCYLIYNKKYKLIKFLRRK